MNCACLSGSAGEDLVLFITRTDPRVIQTSESEFMLLLVVAEVVCVQKTSMPSLPFSVRLIMKGSAVTCQRCCMKSPDLSVWTEEFYLCPALDERVRVAGYIL